jgi:hypothetical protein
MTRQRKKFDREQKTEAIRKIEHGEKTVLECAKAWFLLSIQCVGETTHCINLRKPSLFYFFFMGQQWVRPLFFESRGSSSSHSCVERIP